MRPRTSAARQRGFSLIEMMVATTISLVLLLALVTLLLNMNQTDKEMRKANARIENGRFAVQLLGDELAQAGFWGGHVPQFDDLTLTTAPADVPAAVPNPCAALTPATWTADYKSALLAIPVQVHAAVPTGCEDIITDRQPNTDILIVRRAAGCVAGAANCDADTAGRVYLQVSDCATEIGATPPAKYTLGTSGFSLHKKNCATAADKRQFMSHLYYVRTYADTAGDGIPTLVRSDLDLASGVVAHQAPQALIEGVEAFFVELGIDNRSTTGALVNYAQAVSWSDPQTLTTPTNRGDGEVDGNFIHCGAAAPCTADQLINVVAVKLHVLTRSSEPTDNYTDTKRYKLGTTTLGPYNDGILRHAFSTTLRLTNVAGRRETP